PRLLLAVAGEHHEMRAAHVADDPGGAAADGAASEQERQRRRRERGEDDHVGAQPHGAVVRGLGRAHERGPLHDAAPTTASVPFTEFAWRRSTCSEPRYGKRTRDCSKRAAGAAIIAPPCNAT